jgi:hypothetical protein
MLRTTSGRERGDWNPVMSWNNHCSSQGEKQHQDWRNEGQGVLQNLRTVCVGYGGGQTALRALLGFLCGAAAKDPSYPANPTAGKRKSALVTEFFPRVDVSISDPPRRPRDARPSLLGRCGAAFPLFLKWRQSPVNGHCFDYFTRSRAASSLVRMTMCCFSSLMIWSTFPLPSVSGTRSRMPT